MKFGIIAAAILVIVIAIFMLSGKPAGTVNCKPGDVACDYTKG